MDSEATTIDLLRHGEPIGGRKFRGSVDDPLSEKGWAQMRAAVGNHCPWHSIVSSPLARCADFAQEIAGRHGLPLSLNEGLREFSFGAWDGRAVADVEAEQPEALNRFWGDPVNYAPPDAEPLDEFRSRITATWATILEQAYGRQVLVITHGGVMRMVLCHLLEIPLRRFWRLHVPYAGLSRIKIRRLGEQAEPQVLFHACARYQGYERAG